MIGSLNGTASTVYIIRNATVVVTTNASKMPQPSQRTTLPNHKTSVKGIEDFLIAVIFVVVVAAVILVVVFVFCIVIIVILLLLLLLVLLLVVLLLLVLLLVLLLLLLVLLLLLLYLHQRRQPLTVLGSTSSFLPITSGVLQEPILRLISFLLDINL